MIDYEMFCKIKYLEKRDGLTASQIAEELALDPRTVRKLLVQKQFRPRKTTTRPSKLDPFKNDIVRMLNTHRYSAAQVLQRIRDLTAAIPSLKNTCERSGHRSLRLFSRSLLLRVSVLKSTGDRMVRLT